MNYFSAENLGKSFGEQELFEGLTFGLARGDKVALVARNGTGKTTLLRILMGKEAPDSGEFTFRKGIRVGFLEQNPTLDTEINIDELISSAHSGVSKTIRRYAQALEEDAGRHTAESQRKLEEAISDMDRKGAWDYERRLKQLLDLFRITDTSQLVGSLSGGEQKRLALALVLLDKPDLLVLDEPTNHLDIDMIEWLEQHLEQSKLTLLMVTHDRYFLDRVCNRILELDGGQLYQYEGNYEYFLGRRAERQEQERTEADKAGQLMKRELEWLRRMPKARTHKSKSRIDAFDGIKARATLKPGPGELKLMVKSPRTGGKILELEGIAKAYGSRQIIAPFTYKFQKGDRVGIIGRNGTGKTTFLDLIGGEADLDEGHLEKGETIVMSYYRQMGQEWDPGLRVIDAVKEIAEVVSMQDGSTISASRFLEHFMFGPEAQYKRIAKLSGGELRRLHLLTVLIRNPNFLLLDEPTNDLDLFALNRLEEFLIGFEGCLVIVSHDRYFLDKLTDHLFVFGGDGSIEDFYGSYVHYQYRQEKLKAGEKSEKSAAPVPSTSRKTGKSKSAEKTRLSYREQQEYERLEPEIEELENEKEGLEAALNEGSLSYEALEEKSRRVAEVIALIDKKMERWMELGQYIK